MYVYDSSRFASYKDRYAITFQIPRSLKSGLIMRRWVAAADSTMAHLASHPSSRPDLTFLAMFNGKQLDDESGHLACFDGGNFILGGLVLNQQKYIDFGLQLVAACEDTYNQTLTGIGPESFSWNTSNIAANQVAFYQKAGFYITSSYCETTTLLWVQDPTNLPISFQIFFDQK